MKSIFNKFSHGKLYIALRPPLRSPSEELMKYYMRLIYDTLCVTLGIESKPMFSQKLACFQIIDEAINQFLMHSSPEAFTELFTHLFSRMVGQSALSSIASAFSLTKAFRKFCTSTAMSLMKLNKKDALERVEAIFAQAFRREIAARGVSFVCFNCIAPVNEPLPWDSLQDNNTVIYRQIAEFLLLMDKASTNSSLEAKEGQRSEHYAQCKACGSMWEYFDASTTSLFEAIYSRPLEAHAAKYCTNILESLQGSLNDWRSQVAQAKTAYYKLIHACLPERYVDSINDVFEETLHTPFLKKLIASAKNDYAYCMDDGWGIIVEAVASLKGQDIFKQFLEEEIASLTENCGVLRTENDALRTYFSMLSLEHELNWNVSCAYISQIDPAISRRMQELFDRLVTSIANLLSEQILLSVGRGPGAVEQNAAKLVYGFQCTKSRSTVEEKLHWKLSETFTYALSQHQQGIRIFFSLMEKTENIMSSFSGLLSDDFVLILNRIAHEARLKTQDSSMISIGNSLLLENQATLDTDKLWGPWLSYIQLHQPVLSFRTMKFLVEHNTVEIVVKEHITLCGSFLPTFLFTSILRRLEETNFQPLAYHDILKISCTTKEFTIIALEKLVDTHLIIKNLACDEPMYVLGDIFHRANEGNKLSIEI